MLALLNKSMSNNETEQVTTVTLEQYNKKQIEWINVHKYYLSQQAGYDVGFNAAANSWIKTGLAADYRKKHKVVSK